MNNMAICLIIGAWWIAQSVWNSYQMKINRMLHARLEKLEAAALAPPDSGTEK